MWFSKKKPSPLRIKDGSLQALRSLALRLSLNSDSNAPGIIAFMSARKGEGTTTLALQYATLLSNDSGKKVLLIDAAGTPAQPYLDLGLKNRAGIIDAALANEPLANVLIDASATYKIGRWVTKPENRAEAIKMSQNPEFWARLRSEFGHIVFDCASLHASYDGVVLAAKADAAVMVVEAESTPAPVSQKLRDTLHEAGAKLAGAVLTKRRFYIPSKVYKKL